MHDHEIHHLPELRRREFLKGAFLSTGLLFLNQINLQEASAATVNLAGFAAFEIGRAHV